MRYMYLHKKSEQIKILTSATSTCQYSRLGNPKKVIGLGHQRYDA